MVLDERSRDQSYLNESTGDHEYLKIFLSC